MVGYDFTSKARRQIKKIPKSHQKRIISKLEQYLARDKPLEFAKALGRSRGKMSYRYRVGE